jgi:hypothetical protein
MYYQSFIGRRSGLKIRRPSPAVGVQVPLRAPAILCDLKSLREIRPLVPKIRRSLQHAAVEVSAVTQDWQLITADYTFCDSALPCQPPYRLSARGMSAEQTPNRGLRPKTVVITCLCATSDPRFSTGSGGTNVGTVCSCHLTGTRHHRPARVPSHPVWPKASRTLFGKYPRSPSWEWQKFRLALPDRHPSRILTLQPYLKY